MKILYRMMFLIAMPGIPVAIAIFPIVWLFTGKDTASTIIDFMEYCYDKQKI